MYEAALAIMADAAQLTLQFFNRPDLQVEFKGDGSPVTAADLATETLIRERVGALFPNDHIVGEEHGTSTGSGSRTWVIDPIDGTKAFARGVELYSCLLAVNDEHGPLISVIALPALGEVVSAARGLGCHWNQTPCRVSSLSETSAAILTTSGFDYWTDEQMAAARKSGMQLRTWGDGYGYALVATGRAEVMIDPVAAHWDLAPMPLLLAEAGGRFTALDGREGVEHGTGIASNGLLHDSVVALFAPE
jgi:histidinol phosphatase-like enzyme (inositol monophosphatase family)